MNRLLHRNSRREEALSDLRFTICDLRAFRHFARQSSIVNRQSLRKLLAIVSFAVVILQNISALAEQRFPPPDFSETGHQLPITTTPPARAGWLQYLDVAVLAVCLGVAVWFIYKQRSRRGLFWLSIFSLAYFGFWRKGCVCAIGAPQNIILGMFDANYTVPLTVVAFFALPLVVALFVGRAFCAGVCPHGALQDLLLIKPLKVPAWLEHALGVLPFIFLGFGLAFPATGTRIPICRYAPIVPIIRLNRPPHIIT
ncbi:MAG: 4Fe-4S binding protein, partial [Verrucomicrobiota bacterium]